jgi:hypothetical protein
LEVEFELVGTGEISAHLTKGDFGLRETHHFIALAGKGIELALYSTDRW